MTEQRTIRAAVLRAAGEPVHVEKVLLAPPMAGEVLVRVAAAGVCHSDLHLAEGHLGDGRWPTVLGHEGAGVIDSVGDGVTELAPGDRVAFCFVPSCRSCERCTQGFPALCSRAAPAASAGTMLDGTTRLSFRDGSPIQHFNFISCFAEHVVIPAASAVPIPAELSWREAALLGCGAVTGFGAVRNAARVGRGRSVCVVGCGGVGLQVVRAARLAGADPIIAVDLDPANLTLAMARGATHAVEANGPDAVEAVRSIADGGVDHAFEVVGRSETIRTAFDVLRAGATAVVVGIAPRGIEVSLPAQEFLSEKGIRGSFYGSGDPAADLADLARLAVGGALELEEVVSHIGDLESVQEAFDRMKRGEGARTVVVFD